MHVSDVFKAYFILKYYTVDMCTPLGPFTESQAFFRDKSWNWNNWRKIAQILAEYFYFTLHGFVILHLGGIFTIST